MGWQDVADFFSREEGQKRRQWLNDRMGRVAEVADYYLGPTGIPDRLVSAGNALAYTDAGDMVEAADASRALWNDPTIENVGRYMTAGTAMMLPFIGGKAAAELSDNATRWLADESGALIYRRPSGEDFRGIHRAPGRDGFADGGAAALDDLTAVFPEDVYDPRVAARYYGHGGNHASMDQESLRAIWAARGNPDAEVAIYRGVPADASDDIYPGDWVTLSRKYAEEHAQGFDNPKILEERARVGDLFSDANSINEFGWDPDLEVARARGLLQEDIADPVAARGDEILSLVKTDPASVTDDMLDLGDPVLNTRLNEYLFRNYDLPMDTASRMRRAEDMGADPLMEYYHGTAREGFVDTTDIMAFDPERVGDRWNADERGFSMTSSPQDANYYARRNDSSKGDMGDGAVYPLVDMSKNPMRLRPKDQYAGTISTWDERPANTYDLLDAGRHDAVDIYADGVNMRVSMDPTNIRSRFARFDPRLSHLRNLNAGLAGIGMGSIYGLQPQQEQY